MTNLTINYNPTETVIPKVGDIIPFDNISVEVIEIHETKEGVTVKATQCEPPDFSAMDLMFM
ncbi:hypothetical protein [Psychrobium sp. 1_MG-2023]|uniref:hypothetical protein n=1 Tax=Psychrobium sp. 1_MG-2023 TaxID=3062624 RepID=UPI000C33A675|nr:hypothetical protein [Psychrobium sp. 1_MG-2023]MDP2559733.1 hypothetical protein [Psychrobium sp. 1_MG-2023]PKF59158.1 hypothetical protein CW748_02925 [Alteromonadales bacterium alter-6D02]